MIVAITSSARGKRLCLKVSLANPYSAGCAKFSRAQYIGIMHETSYNTSHLSFKHVVAINKKLDVEFFQ